MEPNQFERLEAMRFIGLQTHCPDGNNEKICRLWDQLFETTVPQSQGSWGVSWGDSAGGFHYLAGHRVPPATPAPAGLIALDIPAARYIKTSFADHPSRMPAAFAQLFASMKASDLRPMPGGVCLERYSHDCSDQAAGTLRAELYVPVA